MHMAAHPDARPPPSAACACTRASPPRACPAAKRWLRVLAVLTNDPDAAYLLGPSAIAAVFLATATNHDLRPARHGIALVLRWQTVAAQTPDAWAFHWAELAADQRAIYDADKEAMDERTVLAPSEERTLLTVAEQGFYELRPSGRGSGGASAVSLASNLDPAESDLASLDPEELVASVALREMTGDESGDASESPAEQESAQGYWWYLLVIAFLLLIAESILSNRLSRARTLAAGQGPL